MQKYFFSALMAFLLWVPAGAVSFYGNQSSIQWKTAHTQNFIFHYPSEYQEHAAQIAAFAETVHDTVVKRYHSELPGQVNLVIRNSLFSNGLASPVYNMMNVWLTDWDFKIRSTHNWMRDVVTHEFSHLVSIQSGSKTPGFIHGLQFSYQDFSNERIQNHAAGIYPFIQMPMWFAEGTAQYESARMGFDAWDTHRDMLLRVAVLNDQLLPLEYMHDFPEDGLGGELGPYNQGFSLVRYISKHYGDAAVPALWAELRRMHRSSIDGALQQTLGINEPTLYNNWKAEQITHYENQKKSLGLLRTGIKISQKSSFQDFPIVAGGHLYGISNFGGPHLMGDLFRLDLGDSAFQAIDSTKALSMAPYAYSGFQAEKSWMTQGVSVVESPSKSPMLAYVSYRNRDRQGKAYFDIMIADTLGNQWEATRFADAVYPHISPDAQQVAFVRREADGTRFHLSRTAIPAKGTQPSDYVDLYSPPDSLSYFGIYTPRWSPDGSRIAFSYYDGQSRKVAVIDSNGQNFRTWIAGEFDARDPVWTADGQGLYYSCDFNGIYNLYQLDFKTGASKALTRVLGGAFSPVVDSTGLYYIGYDRDGFSLYKLPFDSLKTPLPPPASPLVRSTQRPTPLDIPDIEFESVQQPYRAIPNLPVLVPLLSIEERAPDFGAVNQGVAVPKAGFAIGLQDALQKNFLQIALLLELGNGVDFIDQSGLNPSKHSDLFASLENRSFPITLQAAYLRRNITSRDTVRYEDPRSYSDSIQQSHYAVTLNAVQAGAGYSILKEGDSLAVSASYDWSAFNLYEDGFAWDYHKRYSLGTQVSWRSDDSDASHISGAGTGVVLGYTFSNSQLFRPGTFAESFTVSAQGVITPHYREYQLHDAQFSLFGSLPNPLHSGAQLSAGVRGAGLMHWQGQDTLDNFYRLPLVLDGYPLLKDSESYTRQGQRTAVAEVHYLFPLYSDWRQHFWIFTTRDLYLDIFAQVGNAWDQGGMASELKTWATWDRSVGLEWRWSNRLFYTYPFDISLKLARGLDRVGKNAQGMGGDRLSPIGVPIVPDAVSPTRIQFNIGMGFHNTWMN